MAFVNYPPGLTVEQLGSMTYNRLKFLAGKYPTLFDYGRIAQNVEVYGSTISSFVGRDIFKGKGGKEARETISLRYLDDLIEDLELRADIMKQIPLVNRHRIYRELMERFSLNRSPGLVPEGLLPWNIGEA